jgi:teichuronic acid exporter
LPSIKQKTISGIIWSSVDNFTTQGIVFVVGIVLARLLEPKEFGLIGMITIFIAVSEAFIKSGFSEALIRKKDCTQIDYSTVFFFNLTAGIILFSILFILAPEISSFFKEPLLKSIIRVLAIVLIIDSLTIIQRTTLVKRVDFKLQARISFIASTGSGIIAIILAYKGFGVWSLVALTIARQGLNSLLLWLWNKWRPTLIFSKDSFKELFGFGNKLLLSGLIDTVYNNIYYLVIGKYFSATELGFYTRAHNFSNFPSHNINTIVGRVTYPVLSDMQAYPDLLKSGYRRIIKSTMLITFVLMLGLAAIAEPMIITLIGEKWRPAIPYLQLLCFSGMLYPLHSLNLNMLKVLGRSDLFLKLEIIKKSLAIPVIITGIFFGIKIMIIGMILNSFIAYYINSYFSGRLINYGLKDQVRDIAPSFLLAVSMAFTVYIVGHLLNTSSAVTLIIQVAVGGAISFAFWEMLKIPDYLYMKQVVIEKFFSRKQI